MVNPAFSQIQVIYNFTKDLYISVAVIYSIDSDIADVNVNIDTYYLYGHNKMISKWEYPWVLLRYTIRKMINRKLN